MYLQPHTENQTYEMLLIGHLNNFIYYLRQLPADKWDWTPDPAAPTARILASHAWQWLQCVRQHIAEPDASKHRRIPETPTDPVAMCDLLQTETDAWQTLLRDLTPEQLDAERSQFNRERKINVRYFVYHMIQNTIYKVGQFMTLYFALGLDGTEPYGAPFPNPIYEECFGPAPSEE